MKKLITTIVLMAIAFNTVSGQCKDIDTKAVVNYLNKNIKPRLDLKLDKDDGFLFINGNRQNFSVSVETRPISRKWTYHFENVRRADSNFFYDSRKNSFALDVKFEDSGVEIKGLCPGCIRMSRDRRAPDIEWKNPQILRIFLKPIIYQNSISFSVSDIEFIGKFVPNGTLSKLVPIVGKIENKLKSEMIKLFQNGQTRRSFNDAIKPLLNANRIARSRSVTLASSSMRVCR